MHPGGAYCDLELLSGSRTPATAPLSRCWVRMRNIAVLLVLMFSHIKNSPAWYKYRKSQPAVLTRLPHNGNLLRPQWLFDCRLLLAWSHLFSFKSSSGSCVRVGYAKSCLRDLLAYPYWGTYSSSLSFNGFVSQSGESSMVCCD